MNLQETIQDNLKKAMKSKDKETMSLLRVVIGDMGRKIGSTGKYGIDLTDDQVLKIIRKGVKDAKTIFDINGSDDAEREIKILSEYLPSMLVSDKLETIITDIITTNSFSGKDDMGKVMSNLKQNYGGTYDGRLASQLVRKILI